MRITHGSRDTFPCPANRRFWLSTYVLHASTTLSLPPPPRPPCKRNVAVFSKAAANEIVCSPRANCFFFSFFTFASSSLPSHFHPRSTKPRVSTSGLFLCSPLLQFRVESSRGNFFRPRFLRRVLSPRTILYCPLAVDYFRFLNILTGKICKQ